MVNPIFSQDNPEDENSSLKKRADAGFADAQYHIGLCYNEGKGIEQSYKLAFKYFKLAADQGFIGAQVFLATFYEEGLGTERSYSQAIRYYKLAAKQGNATAQVHLGNLYWEGSGVQKSPIKAVEYYQKAAKQGNSTAWERLAEAYEKGIGIEKSEKQARFFRQKRFQHAKEKADAGDAHSQLTVGDLFEAGEGVEKSFDLAFYYYQLAANQNFAQAFFYLAECYAKGKGTQKSVENAIHYYKLAAEQCSFTLATLSQATLGRYLLKNNMEEEMAVEYLKKVVEKRQCDQNLLAFCEFELGSCFEAGKGTSKSDQNAVYCYKLAADHGNEFAQERLGEAFLKGELGISKSPVQAIYYYELAANQGCSSALEILGNCYEKGAGVQQSPEKAFQYYKMAADIDMRQGYSPSIFALARCYKMGIGTEKSLEKAIHYYKFAAENGFTSGYSKAAQCYKELGGKENEEKANAYSKMADAAMNVEMEEKIVDMKKQHAFSSINFEKSNENKNESSSKKGEDKSKISCEESQILCLISDYFPEIEKEETAFLAYLDTDVVGLTGFKKQKGMRLHHLTPWNIHQENIKDILQSGRLAVIVSSDNKKDRLYLTESAQKNLTKRNVVIVIYPYYAEGKRLEKLFSGEITPSEEPYRCFKTIQIQAFSQNQYACAHKMCLVVFTSQSQLGGSENILLGGMFLHSNKNVKSAEIATVNGLSNDEVASSYFYLSKKGLNRLGGNSRILQLEMISKENIENVENWHKIIEESRLILIGKNKNGKEQLLLHHKILEDKPQWKEMLIKGPVTPLAIEDEGKFILYKPDVSLSFISQKSYDRIAHKFMPFIHNWFL